MNESLAKCGGDIAQTPISLDEDSEILNTDLRYENIAQLLNDYAIEGGPWSKSKISKIYKNNSLVNLANEFAKLRISNTRENIKRKV